MDGQSSYVEETSVKQNGIGLLGFIMQMDVSLKIDITTQLSSRFQFTKKKSSKN